MFDAETHIFEYLARVLPQGATGVIDLYTEITSCVNCYEVMSQFMQRFPGIQIFLAVDVFTRAKHDSCAQERG